MAQELLHDARSGAFDEDKDALPRRLAGMKSPEVREAATLLGVNTEGDRSDDVRDKLRHVIGTQRGQQVDEPDSERARLRKLELRELAELAAERNNGVQILGTKEVLIDAILGPRVVRGRKFHASDTAGTRRLRRFARGESNTTENFESGFGVVRLMENDQGEKVVHKHIKSDWFTTGEQQSDAENLSSRVGRTIGAPVPDVYQDSPRSVYMSYVDGELASQADDDLRAKAIASPQGRQIALLDALTGNEDRHGGNWVIDSRGRPVAIDNGLGFRVRSARNADGSSRPAPAHDGDEFRHHWGTVTGAYEESEGDPEAFDWGTELPWTREELEAIRPKLQALAPEFAQLNRQDWHKEMMDRLEAMIQRATPRKDREAKTPSTPKLSPERLRRIDDDAARAFADLAGSVEENIAKGASAEAIKVLVRSRLRRLRIERDGDRYVWRRPGGDIDLSDRSPTDDPQVRHARTLAALASDVDTDDPDGTIERLRARMSEAGFEPMFKAGDHIPRPDDNNFELYATARMPAPGARMLVIRPGYTRTLPDGSRVIVRPSQLMHDERTSTPRKIAPGAAPKDTGPTGTGSLDQDRALNRMGKADLVETALREGVLRGGLFEERRPLTKGELEQLGKEELKKLVRERRATRETISGRRDEPRGPRVEGRDVANDSQIAAAVQEYLETSPKVRRPITRDRAPESTSFGDATFEGLAAQIGFDGLPEKASPSRFDDLVRDRTIGKVLYRGVQSSGSKTAAEVHEQVRDGDFHAGHGTFGNGIYMATTRRHAESKDYQDGTPGAVARYGLRRDAKIISWDELVEQYRQWHEDTFGADADYLSYRDRPEYKVYGDPGRWAAARGYDAIFIPKGASPTLGNPAAGNQYAILNRTALIAEEPDGPGTVPTVGRDSGPDASDDGGAPRRPRSQQGGDVRGATAGDEGPVAEDQGTQSPGALTNEALAAEKQRLDEEDADNRAVGLYVSPRDPEFNTPYAADRELERSHDNLKALKALDGLSVPELRELAQMRRVKVDRLRDRDQLARRIVDETRRARLAQNGSWETGQRHQDWPTEELDRATAKVRRLEGEIGPGLSNESKDRLTRELRDARRERDEALARLQGNAPDLAIANGLPPFSYEPDPRPIMEQTLRTPKRRAERDVPVHWSYGPRGITSGLSDWSEKDKSDLGDAIKDWTMGVRERDDPTDNRNITQPNITGVLRGLLPNSPERERQIELIDRAFNESRTDRDLVLYRGFDNGSGILPDDWEDRDLTGVSWHEPGYTSSTDTPDSAATYAGAREDRGFAARFFYPKGSRALVIRDEEGGLDDEGEVALPRNLDFEVIADHGIHDGIRWVDIKVTEAKPRAVPRKKATTNRREATPDDPGTVTPAGRDSRTLPTDVPRTPSSDRSGGEGGDVQGATESDQVAPEADPDTRRYDNGRDLTEWAMEPERYKRIKRLAKEFRETGPATTGGGYGDPVLRELAEEQGWLGTPEVGSPERLNDEISRGGIELWRGVRGQLPGPDYVYGPGFGRSAGLEGQPIPIPDQDNPLWMHRQLRSGPLAYGTSSMYGNGIYTSVSRDTADRFGETLPIGPQGDPRHLQRMVLRPDARIIDFEEVDRRLRATDAYKRLPVAIRNDPGRAAMALGYDVMRVRNRHDGGPMGEEGPWPDQYVILNRNAVVFQDHDQWPVGPYDASPQPIGADAGFRRLFPDDYGPEEQLSLADAPAPLRRRLHQIFDIDHGDLTIRIEDEASSIHPDYYGTGEPTATVTGTIRNKQGEIVGSYRRILNLGTGVVTNDSFAMDEAYQRQGLSTAFNDRQDRELASLGFTRAIISPAFRGSYPAARRGYTWRTDRVAPAGDVPTHIGAAIPRATPAQRRKLNEWLDRFAGERENWPSPQEIASYGALGRSIMEPASWEGEKPLRAPDAPVGTRRRRAARGARRRSIDEFRSALPSQRESRAPAIASRAVERSTAPLTGNVADPSVLLTGDTGPEGRRIQNLTLTYDGYTIKNGTAWHQGGVTYVIEHGSSPDGFARAARVRDQLAAHQASLPVDARHYQRSYVVAQGANPADKIWGQQYSIPDFESLATAQYGNTTIWNSERTMQRPNIAQELDHEFGHNVSSLSEERLGQDSPDWAIAGESDLSSASKIRSFTPRRGRAEYIRTSPDNQRNYPNGITNYGTSSPGEDYAEAIALYTQGIIGTGILPGRRYIEPIWFIDMFPERAAFLAQLFPEFHRQIERERRRIRALPYARRLEATGLA